MSELPKAWGVLYAPPNPDGSKKKCGNCAFFIQDAEQCMIHDEDIQITERMVCGYHVFGDPVTLEFADAISAEPIDPKLSGLEDTGRLDGTSCSSCVFFEGTGPGKGLCHGVAKEGGQPPQPVQPLGCCARWERR